MWTQYATQGFRTRAAARAAARATNANMDPARPGLRWRAGSPVLVAPGQWRVGHYWTRHPDPSWRAPLPASWRY